MNIEEMEAGPELDALIAQEIFGMDILGIVPCERDYDGWHWSTAPCNPDCEWAELRPLYMRDNQCSCDLIGGDDEYPPEKRLGHYWTCLEAVPQYSCNMIWAWQVINTFPSFSIQKWTYGDENTEVQTTKWEVYARICDFGHEDSPMDCCGHTEAFAETAPLAICRAVLKYVRAQPIRCCEKGTELDKPT